VDLAASSQFQIAQEALKHKTDTNGRLQGEIAILDLIVKEAKEKLDAAEKRASVAQDGLSKPYDLNQSPHLLIMSWRLRRRYLHSAKNIHGYGTRA